MGQIGFGAEMAKFSYGRFSDEAREAAVTAADVALSGDSEAVLPEHLWAAVNGAERSERCARERGRIPFADSTAAALRRAHDAAVSAGAIVELHHLRDALRES